MVAALTRGLLLRGHEVTLFASGDSAPFVGLPREAAARGRLEATVPFHLGSRPEWPGRTWETLHIAHAFETIHSGHFDLVHSHLNCWPLAWSGLINVPLVTTLHGSAYLEPDTHPLYLRYASLPYAAISEAERSGLPSLNYVATVYNGIELADFPFVPRSGSYLAFYGRLARGKGADRAIEVARRSGVPLRIAGPVPQEERRFFQEEIEPHLGRSNATYVGELAGEERARFLQNATALLQLNRVPEPFGLAMVEAMACGTPVIGTRIGAIPEVVQDGVTGLLVSSQETRVVAQAVAAVDRLGQLDRGAARQRVEQHFSIEAMVDGYERVYAAILH